MFPSWVGLLPDAVALDLQDRWNEPHRDYHSATHLVAGMEALDLLGAGRLERIAFWFHDAVHSNSTPTDEEASAVLVHELLHEHLPEADRVEVGRLVLLTVGHRVEPGDEAGARVCDADLASLGADWATYVRNVEGIRRELPFLSEEQWRAGRSVFLSTFLEREPIFATDLGRRTWEARARANLERELGLLQVPTP